MGWHMRKYRPGAFSNPQYATCRKCDQRIHFEFRRRDTGELYPSSLATHGVWMHEGVTEETYSDEAHHAEPKEFCMEYVTVDEYDICGRPIKYENIQSGDLACGIHIRDVVQRRKNEENRIASEQARLRREEQEAFEIEHYTVAAQWIRDNGFGHLIEGYEPKPSKWYRLERKAAVDVVVLRLFLEEIVNKLARMTEGEEEGQDPDGDPWASN